MTAIIKRNVQVYITTKRNKPQKVLYTKIQTLGKNQDNFRYVFIYQKYDTLRYAIFHEKFEVGIYIQKSWHFALRDVFIHKKPDTSQNPRQFALHFYIKNPGHFESRTF